MATIVLTVGSAGRNYATFQLAADSIPKNVVASGNTYIIRAYNDSVFSGTARLLNLTGFTTDATHNIRIEAAAGQSFKDNANVLTNALRYNASNGVALSMTCGYEYAVYSDAPYTVVDGLQVLGTNYTASGIFLTGDNSTVQNCIVDCKPQVSAGTFSIRVDSGLSGKVINTVVIMRQDGSNGIAIGDLGLADNCTVVAAGAGLGSKAVGIQIGSATIRNTGMFRFSTDVGTASGSSGGNNATDLVSTTGPTAGTLTSLAYTNQFVNTVDTTLDLRLKVGSALIDAGVTGFTNTSIGGVQRPSGVSPDIGAWEYAQPATAPFAPTIGSASSTAGAASVSFTANGNGGATITSFLVTSTPGNITGTGASSPVSVTGLTNGVAYTFTVKAVNSVGTGAASASSNSVTPVAAPTGTITSQPAVDGQSQRFVGTTTGATSANFTLTGSAGGVTQTGTFAITANAFDFTVTALVAGNYAPTLTVTGAGGVVAVTGTSSFSVLGVSGGGTSEASPLSITSSSSFSLAENTTSVGSVTATTTTLNSIIYSITGGVDSSKLSINSSTGLISFITAPDFEIPTDVGANNVYNITVQASDSVQTVSQSLSITVTDVFDTVAVEPVGTGKLKRWNGSAWVSVVGAFKTWNGSAWVAIL